MPPGYTVYPISSRMHHVELYKGNRLFTWPPLPPCGRSVELQAAASCISVTKCQQIL